MPYWAQAKSSLHRPLFKYAIILLDRESHNIRWKQFCSPQLWGSSLHMCILQARNQAAMLTPPVSLLHSGGSQTSPLNSTPSHPLHPLGTTLVPSFVTMSLSDYPNTSQSVSFLPVQPPHCCPRTLPKKHTLSCSVSKISVEYSLPMAFQNLAPTSLNKLISYCPSCTSCILATLNLEVKFMDFRIR